MPVTVNVNELSVIHQTSNGIATATIPDVCQTPSPAGPVPIPYPNIAMSSDLVSGTTTVTVDGSSAAIQSSKFVKSTGDEPGVAGGVTSGVFAMEATFLSFSPTVTFDGQPVCRLTDKMLMNKGNTVCMAGDLQSTVTSSMAGSDSNADQSYNPEAAKHCSLIGVIVNCGHDSRGVSVDLSKREGQPLQVVSPVDKPDNLLIQWNGTCGFGNSWCPWIGVEHNNKWVVVDKSKGTFDVPAQDLSLVRDWFAVFKLLAMQRNLPHNDYTVGSFLCQGDATADVPAGQSLQVQVFPKAEWNASFSIGYSHKNKEEEDKAGNKKEKPFDYEPEATWLVGGSADATLGRDKFSYSLTSGVQADALPLFGTLLSKIGTMAKVFESMANYGLPVKLEPKWPNWKFSGGLKLIEFPQKLIVGSEGSFKFGFDPLFGMEMEISILDWLIKFAGGLAGPPGVALSLFLVRLRKRLADGAGDKKGPAHASVDIDIVIKVEGEIKGGFGVKYSDGNCEVDSEASSVEASMGVSINGHIIGTGRAWRVEASAAIQVGSAGADGKEPSKITGTLKPKAGKDPLAISGQLVFSGLALYYLGYIEVAIKTDETAPMEHDGDPEIKTKSGWGEKAETRGTCVLIHEWKHPKGGHE